MASKNPQTMAKRAREQAVKERRDRKRARKMEAAAERAAAQHAPRDESGDAAAVAPVASQPAPPSEM